MPEGHPSEEPVDPAGKIDFHYHHITPTWLADPDVQRAMARPVRDVAENWSPASALAEMDANGVQTVITSVSDPGVWFGSTTNAQHLSRQVNEHAATLASDRRGRFYSLLALPLPDLQGSLTEIDYGYGYLGAVGVGLFTSYEGRWFADPFFGPVLEELDRRDAVIFVHPTAPDGAPKQPGIPSALWEYPADTGRAMLQWLLSDAATKYPNLKLVFAHAGAAFLAGLGRLQLLADTRPDLALPTDLGSRAANLYFEISSSSDAVTLGVLDGYVPRTHVLLGTDSPFIGSMGPTLAALARQGLPSATLADIQQRNARTLLGLTDQARATRKSDPQ